jgi:hypothetical protein
MQGLQHTQQLSSRMRLQCMRRPLIEGPLTDEYQEMRVATSAGMPLPFAGGNSLPRVEEEAVSGWRLAVSQRRLALRVWPERS